MSIEITQKGGVQIIRMNRPDKKNAITSAMYGEMADAISSSWSNSEIGACLLLGLPGVFTAGNDIADFMQFAMSGDRGSTRAFDFLEAIITSQKPLIAGVDGMAIGVGVTMLMHCDHVVVSDRSTFKTPFVDLGLIPEAGSSLLAPRIMGYHRAFGFLVKGEMWTANDAKEAGIASQVVSDGVLEEAALAAAADIAGKPPEALEMARKLLRGDRKDILERMREEAVLFKDRLQSEEARAAFVSFMEKGS